MKRIGNTSVDINIAYIGGGSMGWAWGLMSDLALQEQLSGNVRLYDIDYPAAKRNEIIGNLLQKMNIQRAIGVIQRLKQLNRLLPAPIS